MSDTRVAIYVATYADRADALADYGALLDLHEIKRVGSYDVAVISKDAEGKVHVGKHEKPTQHGVWAGVLVGAFVGVLFPPAVVGVATVGGAAAVGGVIGGLGGHFLEGMSRSDAKELGDLLRAGEAALVVIGESARRGARQGADARAEVDREGDRCRPRAAQAGARGRREAARRGLDLAGTPTGSQPFTLNRLAVPDFRSVFASERPSKRHAHARIGLHPEEGPLR